MARPSLPAVALAVLLLVSAQWTGPVQGRVQQIGRVKTFESELEMSLGSGTGQGHDPGSDAKTEFNMTQLMISLVESTVFNGSAFSGLPLKCTPGYVDPWSIFFKEQEECQVVSVLRSVIQKVAVNNTVIMVSANLAFVDMALNMRCRLLALNVTNLLIWALDGKAAAEFERRKISHIYDASLYSVERASGNGMGSTEEYSKMMKQRIRMWWRFLATGFNMLFLDADVVVFRPPQEILEGDADLEGQLDWQGNLGFHFEKIKRESTLCAGVFWIRSSSKTLTWMDRLVHCSDCWNDQMAFNKFIHNPKYSFMVNNFVDKEDRLPGMMDFLVRYSDPKKLLGGTMFGKMEILGSGYNCTFQDSQKQEPGQFSPVLLHLNGRTKESKIGEFKTHGWWTLDDNLECML